eukprot:3453166-Rhodomonas_salina.1
MRDGRLAPGCLHYSFRQHEQLRVGGVPGGVRSDSHHRKLSHPPTRTSGCLDRERHVHHPVAQLRCVRISHESITTMLCFITARDPRIPLCDTASPLQGLHRLSCRRLYTVYTPKSKILEKHPCSPIYIRNARCSTMVSVSTWHRTAKPSEDATFIARPCAVNTAPGSNARYISKPSTIATHMRRQIPCALDAHRVPMVVRLSCLRTALLLPPLLLFLLFLRLRLLHLRLFILFRGAWFALTWFFCGANHPIRTTLCIILPSSRVAADCIAPDIVPCYITPVHCILQAQNEKGNATRRSSCCSISSPRRMVWLPSAAASPRQYQPRNAKAQHKHTADSPCTDLRST